MFKKPLLRHVKVQKSIISGRFELESHNNLWEVLSEYQTLQGNLILVEGIYYESFQGPQAFLLLWEAQDF